MNKTLLTYILLVGIAGTAGTGTGVILKRTVGPIDEIYPPGFSADEYKDDVDALYLSYLEKDAQGVDVTRAFKNSQLVNIGLEKYRRCENSYSITIGIADTIVSQAIRNAQIKNGDEYFEESLSYSGAVQLANRVRQTGKDGSVRLYTGSISSLDSVNYSETYKEYAHDAYKEYLGKTLDEMFIYIISEKTVLSSSKQYKEDGSFTITLSLDPNISTYYYKYQMKNISGLSNLPPFTRVDQIYSFDKDLNLTHVKIDEDFTATKAGIPVAAKTNNRLDIYYYPDTFRKIPEYNEKVDYSILGV